MSAFKFEDLVGETIEAVVGLEEGSDSVHFILSHGRVVRMAHFQDCCETVAVEDIMGDPGDLLGTPVLYAIESTSDDEGVETPECPNKYGYDDLYLWTFYRIQTINGLVVIRWLGESNGFYSVSVDVDLLA